MSDIPATIELNPSGDPPDASIIWLHGLGADGNDFVPIVERFRFAREHKVRFVFPHAPRRPITINGGVEMRAWYDITELDLSRDQDLPGLQASEKLLHLLIEREISHGVRCERIVLAGFSQGGALALYTALRYPKKLASAVVLSGYLPSPTTLANEAQLINQSLPIFMGHGLFDPIVPVMLGQLTKEQLLSLGYPVEWHSYPITHTVALEEIDDLDRFINQHYNLSS